MEPTNAVIEQFLTEQLMQVTGVDGSNKYSDRAVLDEHLMLVTGIDGPNKCSLD